MNKIDITEQLTYKEQFLFRSRTHFITPQGIRTVQNDFFTASETTVRFHELGYLLQYKSDLRLQDVFIAIVFLVLGLKGLSKGIEDTVASAISIILIATALYWTITILFHLKHIGSFYFSNSIEKNSNAFEIKSKYPASEELTAFLLQIKKRLQTIALDELLQSISIDSEMRHVESEANFLKNTFEIDEPSFREFQQKLLQKYEALNYK